MHCNRREEFETYFGFTQSFDFTQRLFRMHQDRRHCVVASIFHSNSKSQQLLLINHSRGKEKDVNSKSQG